MTISLHHVSYESFTRDPREEVQRLMDFLGVSSDADPALVSGISPRSIGKGRAGLADDRRRRLAALGAPELEVLGYATS